MTDAHLKPRLCHLLKWPDFNGYGFNLHAEKGKAGQYIGKVDDGSPARAAGLKDGDRIVEVNGVNIGNENHQQVVGRIKAGGEECSLLVVDKETDQHYKDEKKVVKGDLPEVVVIKCPSHDTDATQEEVPPSYNDATEEATVTSTHVETVESTLSTTNNTTSSQFIPRLCHMKKRPDFNGYGFNLHAERDKPGQFIGKIDDDSPALTADLREGDRIVEVNGTNIESETHQKVIELVKSGGDETTLLVLDKAADEYYKSQGISVSSAMSEVRHTSSVKEEEQVSAVVEPPPVFNVPPPPTELPPPDDDEDDFNVDELRDLGIQDEAVEETVEASQVAEVEAEVTPPEELPPPQDDAVESDHEVEEQISAENAETVETSPVLSDDFTERLEEIAQNSEEITTEEVEESLQNEFVQNDVEVTQAEVADEVQAAVEENNVSENAESNAMNGQTTVTETVTSYSAPEPEPEPTPAPAPVSQPEPTPAPKQANGSMDMFGMSAAEMKERLKARKKQDPRATNVGFIEKHKLFERM